MTRALPALVLVAVLVTACGTSKSAPPATGSPGVRIAVTADWGATEITRSNGSPGTVITATRTVATITTTYGGRYVASIAGQAGDGTRDWIFWVNGIESGVGGADIRVTRHDAVWWDLHRWSGRMRIPAVIANWPMPLTRGIDGSAPAVSADPPLAMALQVAGATVTTPAGLTGARAIVGASAVLLQRDPTWQAAVADPTAAGLTAWINRQGHVQVWDAETGRALRVKSATAVVVATTDGFSATDPPVIIIAGVTAEDASRAAQFLVQQPLIVRNATAICLDASGAIVCQGGRGLTP